MSVGHWVQKLEKQLQRHPWIASLLLNGLAFGLVYGLFEAEFQSNDDTGMMLKVAGITNVVEATRMILFSHVFIGDALVWLYANWPTIPWYAFYLVLALYVGHTAILGTALRRHPKWTLLAVYLLHYVFLGSNLLLELQFTMAACVLAIGAFSLLIFHPLPTHSESRSARLRVWLPLLIGVLLALASGMIRWQSELLVAGLFAPMLLVMCIGQGRREVAWRSVVFVGAILLGLGVHRMDKAAYEKTTGWSGYLEFNPLRAQFTDY